MPSPLVDKFIKIIKEIDPSKHRSDVFRDFCELAFCSLAKKSSPFAEQQAQLEKQYMDVVAKYRNKDDVRRMPELLALAVTALSTGGCDFLGEIAGELGVLDAKLGQFFTPYEVSRLMAEMTIGDLPSKIEEQGFVTIDEPAAGAGGMLLAVADFAECKGCQPETTLWVHATELSIHTYHMCYVQLAARGLAGRVIRGNSLSMEVFSWAYLPATPLFLSKHGDPFAGQRNDVSETPVIATADTNSAEQFVDLTAGIAPVQISLFGEE